MDWVAAGSGEMARVLDGSLAFVDISGFTRLSEDLAARGKAGAEELTGFLDAIFGSLLEIAYGNGGELVKWGGDAVLVWFTGRGHAQRAVEAACRMQEMMGRLGNLKTSVGPSTLRMSVGIGSGSFHFFMVGARHRELLVTGPAATLTAQMEEVAEAGEIVVSRQTAGYLEEGVLGARKQAGFLIAAAPEVVGLAPGGHYNLEAARPSLSLPASLRDYLSAAPVESEHRQVAVAFLEFSGVEELLTSAGVDGLAAELHRLVSLIEEACDRHGVTFWETDIGVDGGKVMLVAGAPRANDDDAGRLLVMVREILAQRCRLRLRAGANFGRVFAGDFGPSYRRTYSAKGDAVNLAARLMSRAGFGELFASELAIRRSRVQFSSDELEPFLVKGKAQPVHAHRVNSPLSSMRGGLAMGPGLVGREAELQALDQRLAAAASGKGSCVELAGPPGIGKSRLITELEQRARGTTVLSVICDEYRSVLAYASMGALTLQALGVDAAAGPERIGAALTRAVERQAPSLAAWLPLLAGVVGAEVAPTPEVSALEERFRRERLETAVLQLLAALLPGPSLLLFDDTQWMDDASAGLVRGLAASISARPWLLVLGRRQQEGGLATTGLDQVLRWDLGPLDQDAVAKLLLSVTGQHPLAPHQLRTISERGGGNPLFLLELVETGRHSGFDTALPDTVEEVLAAQIDRLSPPDRHLLRVASVLGLQVAIPVAEEMLGEGLEPARLEALDEFLVSDLPGSLRFRHNMLRDAAYEGLPYARRRELHARAGEVLERRAGPSVAEIAGLLALHFTHAEQPGPAWRYARLAGERARAVYASFEAATFFEQALQSARALRQISAADLLQVAEALGDARARLGEFAASAAVYRRAYRWASTGAEQARLRFKVALATDRAGNYPLTLRTLALAERSLGQDEGPDAARLRAEIRAQYGLVRHRQGRSQAAVRQLLEAVKLADTAGAPEVLATALVHLDLAELTLGRDRGSEHASRALNILRRLGDQPWLEARALNQLGIREYFAGNWSEAVDYYVQSCEACRRAGDEWTAAVGAGNIAEVLADQGHLERAESMLEGALRTYQAAGTPTFIGYGTMLLGRLAARRGDFERAWPLLEQARRLSQTDGETLQVLQADAARAEALLLAGEMPGAGQLAEQALGRAGTVPGSELLVAWLERVLGLSLAGCGEKWERVEPHLHTSVKISRRRGARYELAMSLGALADLWPSAAPEVRQESLDLFDQLGVVETARSLGRVNPAQASG
jgi:predicted ATPase/class 3 adenylate cyclase